MGGEVDPAQAASKRVERTYLVADIVNADEAFVALEPLPARIADEAPRRGEIGPEGLAAGSPRTRLRSRGRFRRASGAQQMADPEFRSCRVQWLGQPREQTVGRRSLALLGQSRRLQRIEQRTPACRFAGAADRHLRCVVEPPLDQSAGKLAPQV